MDSLQPEHTVDYSYDAVQRLSQVSAVTPAWSINWGYDAYGNRTSQTRTEMATGLVAAQFPTYTNNRNNALSGYYDAAGNILTDGIHPLAYDCENRLKSVSSGGITPFDYTKECPSIAGNDRWWKEAGGNSTNVISGATASEAAACYHLTPYGCTSSARRTEVLH